ncbi:apolipoprotein L4-like [Mixophyes fleayi]|uniref:apolipoprotein L4-like n=1 Tax=Mixophyes fleayi TaxID=3061075 RepID=UPI003F4DFDB3
MTHIQEYKDIWILLLNIFEECIKEMLSIADDIDKFHKGTGSSFGKAGGINTIVGLFLAPFTFGASLNVTGAAASIADTVHIKKKCNRVEEIVTEIQGKFTIIHNISENIKGECEALKSVLDAEQMENMGKIGRRGAFLALEISRLVQLGRISAATARGVELVAQGARAARVISGVFAALFILVDAAFMVKGAIDLHKGAKREAAAEIRKIVHELQEKYDDMQKEDKKLQVLLQDLEAEKHE